MRAEQVKGLMEAYSYVYENQSLSAFSGLKSDLAKQGLERRTAAFLRGERPSGATPSKPASKPVSNSGSLSAFSGLKSDLAKQGLERRTAAFLRGERPSSSPKPAATSVSPKPVATSVSPKPAATSAPKPAATSAPKPTGSAMDQWAKANPKLAAAKAERDRTRGTSATTNPLMKDMKSSMSAPKSPAPSTASTAFGLAKKGVNLAAGVDIFDLVKGHLLDEGYAETEEGAMVIMVNMSEEWRKSILESQGVELDESEKWIQGAIKHPGALHKQLGVPAGEKIPSGKLAAAAEKGGKLGKRARLAQTLKGLAKEEVEQLDEISQKTAIRAYAASKTGEFEGQDSLRDVNRTDNLKKHIVRKFGAKAGEHAEKAAEAETFGRKDASGKSKGLPKPRIEKSDYRTTKDGKMHKQDQRELKTELRIKRDRRLRKEDLEAWVEELIAEGYDLSGYTWEEVAEIYAQKLELSEAQRARENPEDHDKEEKKKYEPVRGERTPMPPRGDKRREEFEKWYAKQMGR